MKNNSVPGWLQISPKAAALIIATLGALHGGGFGHGSEFFGRGSRSFRFFALALLGALRPGFRRDFGSATWLCPAGVSESAAWPYSSEFGSTSWSHSVDAVESAVWPPSSGVVDIFSSRWIGLGSACNSKVWL